MIDDSVVRDNTIHDQPTFDETPWQPAPARQPHLGYTLLLLLIGVALLAAFTVAFTLAGSFRHLLTAQPAHAMDLPKLSILLEALTFAGTFGIALAVFPRMWHRSFAHTIDWHVAMARQHWPKLAAFGIVLSLFAQLLESHLILPRQMPVDAFFQHPSDVWVVAIFGTFVAPICEEVFFRGFLLRGVAIAYDWFATPRTDLGRILWNSSNTLSRRALIVSGILTSGIFAAMHAAQLGFAWNAVAVLWVVGGALTAVRLRLNSVAASCVVHAVYNGWIFAVIFVATGGFRHLDRMTAH